MEWYYQIQFVFGTNGGDCELVSLCNDPPCIGGSLVCADCAMQKRRASDSSA